MEKLTVFLGGTCGSSTWRKNLLPELSDQVDAFDPQLPPGAWNEEAAKIEDDHKEKDDILVYCLTPESDSPYSFAEIAFSACEQPDRTIICFLDNQNGTSFAGQHAKAIKKLTADLKKRNIQVVSSLEELRDLLNDIAAVKCGTKGQTTEGPKFE